MPRFDGASTGKLRHNDDPLDELLRLPPGEAASRLIGVEEQKAVS